MQRSRAVVRGFTVILCPLVAACSRDGEPTTERADTESSTSGPQSAPLHDFSGSPYLEVVYNSVVEGDVWERPELTKRDRSMVTIAVLQALDLDQLREEIVRAIEHGLTAEEISEIILHTAFYAGFPTGMNASAVAGSVFEDRGLTLPRRQDGWVPPPVEPQARTSGGYAAVPRLGALRDVLLYGDVWERPQLSPRDRSLVTVSVLQALNRSELGGHLGRAMQNGATAQELREVVLHVTFYAGWPQAVTAGGLLADLFEQQGIPLGER